MLELPLRDQLALECFSLIGGRTVYFGLFFRCLTLRRALLK